MAFKSALALTALMALASCGHPAPKGKVLPENQTLAMCKTTTLQARTLVGLPNAVQNFFDACMTDKGYGHADAGKCNADYPRPGSNPAYDYVTGRIDLSLAALEDCYKPN